MVNRWKEYERKRSKDEGKIAMELEYQRTQKKGWIGFSSDMVGVELKRMRTRKHEE